MRPRTPSVSNFAYSFGPGPLTPAIKALVAAKPSYLHASASETFQRHAAITSGGYSYIPYTRTYKGLPVEGGDFVVMTDAKGATQYTSVAQTSSA